MRDRFLILGGFMRNRLWLTLAFLLVCVACGGTTGADESTTTSTTTSVATTTTTLGSPTTTTTATSPSAPLDPPWDLVVIGDSFVGWSTWPEIYADTISAELDVEVLLHTSLAGSGVHARRLDQIKADPDAQDLIRLAEVIVVQPQPGFAAAPAFSSYLSDNCGGPDGLQCFRDTATDYRAYIDEYLDLLVSLAQPGTIIRVARTATWGPDGFYPDLRVDDPPALTDFLGLVIAMMEEVRSSAEARGIPSIDVGAAFNGPEYTELAPDDYLVADRLHLAETGSQVVAQLLADLGFEPTIPTE